ncbi:MAG TPA: F0F1 ATP synthase subunit B [Chthoniobacteraceae bacterium]|jgi:F-type H+-transporting ATPase subunit b|nr:F0F1 ATP synthase subunit B [Chthoniobacteraceae bacterium]
MTLSLVLAETPGLIESAKETGRVFGFNGWLFISQCVSFTIVCLLLRKFAYGPVMKVLEERRNTIEQSLKDAARIKEQLAEGERQKAETLAAAEATANKIIAEARATAQVQADKVTAQAAAEADSLRKNAQESARQEHDRMLAELKREVTRLVIDTTSKVTGKVLTSDDHRRLSEEAAREVAA